MVQHYGQLDLGEFAEVDERWWTSLLASLDKLRKLPLKKDTFVISGKGLEVRWGNFRFWQIYQQSEMKYRWTLEEKRAWAKDVSQVILRQKEFERGTISSSSCHAPVLWVSDGAATEMAMGTIGMAGSL